MKNIIAALALSLALLIPAWSQPAEAPDPLQAKVEAAVRWAGFPGDVQVVRSEDPQATNGFYARSICWFGFMCIELDKPLINLTAGPWVTDEIALAIVFHEVGHYYQDQAGFGGNYLAQETDADFVGARLACAYGIGTEPTYDLMRNYMKIFGDEDGQSGYHPRPSMRIWILQTKMGYGCNGQVQQAP